MFTSFGRAVGRCAALALLGTWLTAGCSGEESPYDEVEDWACFEQTRENAGGAGGAAGAGATAGAAGQGGAESQTEVASCDCFGVKAGQTIDDPRPAVSSCSGWRCCYAWPTSDGSYDCRCEDEPAGVQLAGFCSDAALERSGEVVDNCPPTPRDNSAYCAFQGESCAPAYLEEQSLNGCCQGLTCVLDTYGDRVCR